MEFFENEVKVALIVRGESDGEFEEEQYRAYNFLLERWQQLQQSMLESILDYYKQKRYELGYDVEFNEKYPLIETATKILEKITLAGIFVPDHDLNDFLDIGLTFDCTWDVENGLGTLSCERSSNRDRLSRRCTLNWEALFTRPPRHIIIKNNYNAKFCYKKQ
ncbi:hypothetical protein PMEGAPL125_10250 [Priestia megaterium]